MTKPTALLILAALAWLLYEPLYRLWKLADFQTSDYVVLLVYITPLLLALAWLRARAVASSR